MSKTTNILDLNNRLEKVEKENVAQNSYNSLKNRPKINGNLLTGDKTGTQLGLAEAQEVGNISDLTTTDKSSVIGAINEVNSNLMSLDARNKLTLTYNATSKADFLKQILDYVIADLEVGNYVLGISRYGYYFCSVTAAKLSPSRAVIEVVPQPRNLNEVLFGVYDNGTYTYSKTTTTEFTVD